MKNRTLFLILTFIVSAVLHFPATTAQAHLGELTSPVRRLCDRLLRSETQLLDHPLNFEFNVDRALKLSKEIQKDSPDLSAVIADLVALTPPPSRGARITKRAIDITVATLGLIATAPLYPLIATAIKLDSRGPVFYRQERSGQLHVNKNDDLATAIKKSNFKMLKFRSMRIDAEAGGKAIIAKVNDSRVTRVGKFLRKTRLDEIPQFINVLKGDMSVVGPRPERGDILLKMTVAVPYFAERMRHVKPGITGLAQVSLGYTGATLDKDKKDATRIELNNEEQQQAEDFRNKLLYDLVYKSSMRDVKSFLITELSIIVKTPLTMVKGIGR